jgi:hypothetical protein
VELHVEAVEVLKRVSCHLANGTMCHFGEDGVSQLGKTSG